MEEFRRACIDIIDDTVKMIVDFVVPKSRCQKAVDSKLPVPMLIAGTLRA